MSDLCCGLGEGPDERTTQADAPEEAPQRLWQVREIPLAAVAGVLVLAGFVCAWSGWDSGAIGLRVAAAVGGVPFLSPTLDALPNAVSMRERILHSSHSVRRAACTGHT